MSVLDGRATSAEHAAGCAGLAGSGRAECAGSNSAARAPRMTVMRNLGALWRWAGAHPRLVDTGLAVGLLVLALPGLAHPHPDERPPDALTVALLVGSAAALVFRRGHPLRVWAVALLAGVLAVLHSGEGAELGLPTFLALYTVGTRAPVRSTVLATAGTGAAYAVALAVATGTWLDEHGDSPALSFLALGGAAAAVGVAVRSQRAALESAEARARQAELTREEEAERRVTDERLRIARELHDVVAHHISVINVQAGVARHLLDSRPEQARTALGLVREASKTVLSEMSAVVGLLRTEDEDVLTEPAPGLAAIGSLVASSRRAGLDLACSVTGEPYELPPIQDLTAYRVVQESLTNAVKYGTGTADLVIDYRPEALCVQVCNPVGDRPGTSGGGHGLIGMRERVDAVRGRLAAGPEPGGVFAVRAEIPRAPR
jgi:signal transduction histidine kinase